MDEKMLYSQEMLLQRFDSLYEAIIVLSQRARQIGNNQLEAISALQKQFSVSEGPRDSLVDDDFDLSEPRDPIELPHFPKPTVAAIREAIDNKIEWEYIEPKVEEVYVPAITLLEGEIPVPKPRTSRKKAE